MQLGESTGVVRICYNMQSPTWYNNQVHSCCNIAVQFYHVWTWLLIYHDGSNNVVQILFVHQAMNSLFQHAWTSLSTTLFKLANSTMFKPVNRQKQAVQFYVCWFQHEGPRGTGDLTNQYTLETSHVTISILSSLFIRDFKMLGRRRRLKRDINFSIWEKLRWID